MASLVGNGVGKIARSDRADSALDMRNRPCYHPRHFPPKFPQVFVPSGRAVAATTGVVLWGSCVLDEVFVILSRELAVRKAMMFLWLCLMASPVVSVTAANIEAVRGKEYHLTDRHGPWMIMVASFRNVPEDRREEGLSAEEAAAELVYELRKQGVPAYVHSQEAVVGRIETVDRLGREDERIYAAQRDMISVIAGNYESINDKTGQQTLKWIKSFTPAFMTDDKAGAIYRQSPGRRGPLSGAFMTINPLRDPNEVMRRKADPDIARFNNSSAFPLLGCKADYTVQVATFSGRQTTPMQGSRYQGNEDQFDRDLANAASYGLNRAGEDAEHLVAELRKQKIEAFVHHDRFQSIVTVGGFRSQDDPAIGLIVKQFGPQYLPDPNSENKTDSLQPQSLVIENPRNKDVPLVWVFDVNPHVVPVPRAK
jgi:hypothetical protein